MLALALALVAPSYASDSSHRIDGLRSDAMEHYHADDAAGFLSRMEIVAAATHGATDLYNLACGYALTGQGDKAIAILRSLVERGESFDLYGDSDFASLYDRPEFNDLVGLSTYYEEVNRRLEPVRDRAMEHYRAGRYDLFTQIMERVATYSRDDKDIYNLACGYALTGRPEEAIAQLRVLAERGADYGVEDDEDFAILRSDPRFAAIVVGMTR